MGWVGGGGMWILERSLETIGPGGWAVPKEPEGRLPVWHWVGWKQWRVSGFNLVVVLQLCSSLGETTVTLFTWWGGLGYRDGFLSCWACCGGRADGYRSLWGRFRPNYDGGTGGTWVGLSDGADTADESWDEASVFLMSSKDPGIGGRYLLEHPQGHLAQTVPTISDTWVWRFILIFQICINIRKIHHCYCYDLWFPWQWQGCAVTVI